MKDKNNLQ